MQDGFPIFLLKIKATEGTLCTKFNTTVGAQCKKKRPEAVIMGDETWIYFYGIPYKGQNMMWVAEDEPRPVVARKGFQSRKLLLTIFFNCEGSVLVDILPQKTTLTGTYYRQNIFYPA